MIEVSEPVAANPTGTNQFGRRTAGRFTNQQPPDVTN